MKTTALSVWLIAGFADFEAIHVINKLYQPIRFEQIDTLSTEKSVEVLGLIWKWNNVVNVVRLGLSSLGSAGGNPLNGVSPGAESYSLKPHFP